MTPKETQARKLALELAKNLDTDVAPDEIKVWSAAEVYQWIETWGYQWKGKEWVLDEDVYGDEE